MLELVAGLVLLTSKFPMREEHAPPASYVFAQTNRVDVAGGRTQVSAEANVPTQQRGYFPLRVFIDNSLGPTQTLKLGYYPTSGGGRPISKKVEVREGERRTVVLPVPHLFRYGSMRARGLGITEKGDQQIHFNTTYAPQRPVLSLGTPDEFEAWIQKKPAHSKGDLSIFSIDPGDAPTELAAYTGYDAVAIPNTPLEAFTEAQRRALEAYAATGGALVLGKGGRGLAAALPLLDLSSKEETPYGLGRVVVVEGKKPQLGELFQYLRPVVTPLSSATSRPSKRYRAESDGFTALLPQATAPIGRFLLIIGLFTLAIGPGSIWVARRRGPAALLLSIPATAVLTCTAIIGYSLIQDGFTVHASVNGVTLLDQKEHRAITVGLSAYYANLAPGGARFSQLVAVLPPTEGSNPYAASIEWGENATMSSDFVPSRTYREWGYLAVEPTRARLVLKDKGDGFVVQNALGMKIDKLRFRANDVLWAVEALRDGDEQVAVREKNSALALAEEVETRFDRGLLAFTGRALKEREFLARVEGQGFVPAGGLRHNHHESASLVRGVLEP